MQSEIADLMALNVRKAWEHKYRFEGEFESDPDEYEPPPSIAKSKSVFSGHGADAVSLERQIKTTKPQRRPCKSKTGLHVDSRATTAFNHHAPIGSLRANKIDDTLQERKSAAKAAGSSGDTKAGVGGL